MKKKFNILQKVAKLKNRKELYPKPRISQEGKRIKSTKSFKKERKTFKKTIRSLPTWLKIIIAVICTPFILLFEGLQFLFKKIIKHLQVVIFLIIISILSYTIYINHNLINTVNSKLETLETELKQELELQNQKIDTQIDSLEKHNQNLVDLQTRQDELQTNQETSSKELEEKINRISLSSRSGGGSSRTSTSTSTIKATGSKAEYQSYAQSLCYNTYGWSENDFQCLVKLWERESNWNPAAKNKSSGAYGIPQSLPASKMASEGDINDPQVQIRWGLKYIKNRYGNPANAWAHSQQKGWY